MEIRSEAPVGSRVMDENNYSRMQQACVYGKMSPSDMEVMNTPVFLD